MKKYKLIKTYPGSPELNFVAIQEERNGYYSGEIEWGSPKEDIENQSEFWEEVIEKDYEILCIKHKKNKCFYRDSIDLRNLNVYDIHSVKRLSDGEVFTVGDRIKVFIGHSFIKKFNINNLNVLICTSKTGEGFNIENLKHIKKPLFTTEDGVDIFKNTKFWYIDNFIIKTYITREFSEIESSYKTFATEEKAEEYILLNTPCLSLKDISTIKCSEYDFFGAIKKLVEEKIK